MPQPTHVLTQQFVQSPNAATYTPAGGIDLGAAAGVAIFGYAQIVGGGSTTRVDSLTIGGVPVVLGADVDTAGPLGVAGRMRPFILLGSGLTGVQPVVAQQTTLAGVASNLGSVRLTFHVRSGAAGSGATEAAVAGAANRSPTATIASDANSTVVFIAPSSIDQPSVTLTAVAPVVVRTPNPSTTERSLVMEAPGQATTTVAGTVTGGFTPAWSGTVFSVPGLSADTTPPVITGPAGSTGPTAALSVTEGSTAVFTPTANETVTWSLNGGADAARFAINGATGAVTFAAPPSFASPTDADTNNTYIVGVRATDAASNATTQTWTVTVTAAVGFSVAFPQGVATDFTGSSKRLSEAFTGYVVPWNPATPAAVATAARHAVNGVTAANGSLALTGLPASGSVMARLFFGSGAAVSVYTLIGTAA
jgi:hypothetical protein